MRERRLPRRITRDEQPTFEPQRVWREGATGGIEAPLVRVREDAVAGRSPLVGHHVTAPR